MLWLLHATMKSSQPHLANVLCVKLLPACRAFAAAVLHIYVDAFFAEHVVALCQYAILIANVADGAHETTL